VIVRDVDVVHVHEGLHAGHLFGKAPLVRRLQRAFYQGAVTRIPCPEPRAARLNLPWGTPFHVHDGISFRSPFPVPRVPESR
jgi:hypothetical protein